MSENRYFHIAPANTRAPRGETNPSLQIRRMDNATDLPGIQELYKALGDESLWSVDGAPDLNVRRQFIGLLQKFYVPAAKLLQSGGIISGTGKHCEVEIEAQDHIRVLGKPHDKNNEICVVQPVDFLRHHTTQFGIDDLPEDLRPNLVNGLPIIECRVAFANRGNIQVRGINPQSNLFFVARGFGTTLQPSITLGDGVNWSSSSIKSTDEVPAFTGLVHALEKNYLALVKRSQLPMLVGPEATALGVLFADAARTAT